MRGNMKKKTIILTAAAAALAAGLSVGSALAYFTSYCTAEGAVAMDMGFTRTEIHEEVQEGKHITVENVGDYDCFVRVRAFAPDSVTLTYSAEEGGWTDGGDGYWYYDGILPAGSTTSEILVSYTLPAGPGADEELTEDEWNQWLINIIVVQECTPVVYDENGNPYGDWDYVITASDTEQEGVEDEE